MLKVKTSWGALQWIHSIIGDQLFHAPGLKTRHYDAEFFIFRATDPLCGTTLTTVTDNLSEKSPNILIDIQSHPCFVFIQAGMVAHPVTQVMVN